MNDDTELSPNPTEFKDDDSFLITHHDFYYTITLSYISEGSQRFTSTLETLGLWWIMLRGHMQERNAEGNTFTVMHTHTRMHIQYTPYKHTQTPGWAVHDWEVIKEAQRCVEVKGQTNQGSKTERDSISTPGSVVCVCACVRKRVFQCECHIEMLC